jgi:hypothetical protein
MLTARYRRLLLVFLLIIPNLVAILYLGTFHQGAPIQINQRIRQLLTNTGKRDERYSVHYLMGCHSTPLYSHLHVPSVRIDAWTLDCSPKCRASLSEVCESDLFYRDPKQFVENVYNLAESKEGTCTSNDQQGYCSFPAKQVPDLLVVYSAEAIVLKGKLESMGLVQVDRFAHGINGLRVGWIVFGDDFASDSFRHVYLLYGVVELSLDDMVLFARGDAIASQLDSTS